MPHPRDAGKALRVSRYLTEDPHIRFSVWNESGTAEGVVSITEREAGRLARFLRPTTSYRSWRLGRVRKPRSRV